MTSPSGPLTTDPFAVPPAPPEEPKRPVPRWLIALLALLIVIAPAGFIIHVPYYSVGPGPSVDVLTLINVRGAKTYPSKGQLLLTTASVSLDTLNFWNFVRAWLDPSIALEPRSRILTPGLTQRQEDIENQLEMDESKFAAEVAAFRALGLSVTKINGARILSVVEGTPAFGALRAGDLIVAVDNHRVTSVQSSINFLQAHKIGDRVSIGYIRGGKRFTAVLKMIASESNKKRPAIGVTLTTAFRLPHDVEIDTQRIVGPSGGMIFSLAIYDAFTPGDLTGGHIIAGTGEIVIDPTSNVARVGDIGAIEEKVRTAKAHGADIFLAPFDQAAAARAVAPKSMHVYGVRTLAQALHILMTLKPAA